MVDFFVNRVILLPVMRDITQVNIRNQGVAIAEVRGALQALAAATFTTKEQLQARIKHFEEKLANIQNNLTEIEWSESLEWIEDKAGIDA